MPAGRPALCDRLICTRLRDVEERFAQRPAELVPRRDAFAGLGTELFRVRAGIAWIDEPALHLCERDLGMELNRPRVLAQAERL